MIPLPFPIDPRRWPLWGKAIGAVAVLVVAGQVWDVTHPAPPATHTEEVTLLRRELEQEATARREAESESRTTRDAVSRLSAQVAQQERVAANTATQSHEVVYRYLPGSAPPASPVINVLPDRDRSVLPAAGSAGGNPGSPQPGLSTAAPSAGPVEIIVRDTRSEDRSVTERSAAGHTEAAAGETAVSTSKSSEKDSAASATKEKTAAETVVKKDTGGRVENTGSGGVAGRLGIGLTSELRPFAAYDLWQAPLGPRPLHLGGVGAGLFVTGDLHGGAGSLDGGPQVNITPGKSRFFIMGGYAVREKAWLLGGGIKF